MQLVLQQPYTVKSTPRIRAISFGAPQCRNAIESMSGLKECYLVVVAWRQQIMLESALERGPGPPAGTAYAG